MLRPGDFALAPARCPFCGPSLFVRLSRADGGVRCARCAAGVVHVALGLGLRDAVRDLSACDACEFSARGPLVEHLRRHARSLAVSEYFDDLPPGALRGGVRCEDMQRLTYADGSFDVVTHTEVLEHVPDDRRALAELFRVLRPGGVMVFTVPLHGGARTVERARLRDGAVEHLLEPVYHTDPQRSATGILAFRDYGTDILDRLREAGFSGARLHTPRPGPAWLAAREVVIATKDREWRTPNPQGC